MARRAAVSVLPSHHFRSLTGAGPKVLSQRLASSAYPSAAESGGWGVPSQCSISVHSGRDSRQCPALRPRTILPLAPSWVRTRGAIGISPPHFVPGAMLTLPAISGICSRRRSAVGGPVASSRDRRAGSLQPGSAVTRQAGVGDSLHHARALGGGDAIRRTPPGSRQQVAWEDEQGPTHGELFDQGAILVQRLLDVERPRALDPSEQGQVHARRLGRVEHRHRPRRRHRIVAVDARGRSRGSGLSGSCVRCRQTGARHQHARLRFPDRHPTRRGRWCPNLP